MGKQAAIAVCVLMLAGAAWLGYRWLTAAGAGDAVLPAPEATRPDARSASASSPKAGSSEPRPLPPLEARLADILPELERRAAAGEAAAACRLAADRAWCGSLRTQREQHLAWAMDRQKTYENAKPNSAPELNALALESFEKELGRREARLEAMEARCAGVAPSSPSEVAAAWRLAAELGSEAARRYWASGQAIRPDGVLDSLDELALFRARAPRMAHQLVREGDLAMTLAMANATAPISTRTHSLLGQAVDENAALSLALYRRVLAALETVDDGSGDPPLHLVHGVRDRVALVSSLMPEAQLAEADRLQQQFEAPLSLANVPAILNSRGQGIVAPAAFCQAEAGEPLPEGYHVRRQQVLPL